MMKDTISNREIARAAMIYYAKIEGEKIAKKKAAEDEKKAKKAEKAAKKAQKAVDEFTDSVKDLDKDQATEKKEGFFYGFFHKKEDIIDVEATDIKDVTTVAEEVADSSVQESKERQEQSSTEEAQKSEVEVAETVEAKAEQKESNNAAKDSKKDPVTKKQQAKKKEETAVTVVKDKKEEQSKAEAKVDPAECEHPREDDDAEEEEKQAVPTAEKKEAEVVETVEAKAHHQVEADKAAHPAGFNIQNFIKEEAVEETVPMHTIIGQQPQLVKAPAMANPNWEMPSAKAQAQSVQNPVNYFMNQQPNTQEQKVDVAAMYPAGYESMDAAQRCDAIRQICAQHPEIIPPYDPMAGQTMDIKIEELKKHIRFIEGRHKGVDQIQIAGLLSLINNPMLRTKMTEYGSKDRPNNPKLFEVEIAKYGQPGDESKFDMCFEINLKDKKHHMFVLFNSVPEYNPNTRSWNHSVLFGKK